MEPILDKITNTYIFEDFKISEKLKQHNINKTISNNHDKTFRKEVEKEITTILENTETIQVAYISQKMTSNMRLKSPTKTQPQAQIE